jgi:hypothetical protein
MEEWLHSFRVILACFGATLDHICKYSPAISPARRSRVLQYDIVEFREILRTSASIAPRSYRKAMEGEQRLVK